MKIGRQVERFVKERLAGIIEDETLREEEEEKGGDMEIGDTPEELQRKKM